MAVTIRQEIDKSTLPPILREFAGYKLGIENRSRLTVDEYLLDLRTFFRFAVFFRDCSHHPDTDELEKVDITNIGIDFVGSIKTEEIFEFMFYLGSVRHNGAASKARKLTAIKSFYKYVVRNRKLIVSNPTANIDTPKKNKTLPKFLSLEESLELLNSIRSDSVSKTKKRDYAIATLFLNCGMRLSELCGIDMRDLDRNLESVRVTGKGAKERVIYLNSACREAVANYLTVRKLYVEDKNTAIPALFLSSRGERISNKTVQWMIGKYLKLAGLDSRGYSVHKLRHTAATLMYQSGNVDVRLLKDILGHEQLTTTQIYTHVSNEGIKSAMEKNPLSTVRADEKGGDTDSQ